jgi:hypothetical protein
MAVELNKSLAQSNDLVAVSGTLSNTGTGTVAVTNLGSALTVGDTFVLFSQPLANGAAMTIAGAGATWTNNLAVDGSITVLAVAPTVNTNSTNIIATVSGSQLILSWPADHTGWKLQAQTNTLANGLGTNWVTISGTDASNSYTNSIAPANGSVFYRMVYP